MSLPPLPGRTLPWSPSIYEAFHLLNELYRRPQELLASQNYNTHRIEHHNNLILKNAIPLLIEVEAAAEAEDLPMTWVNECADCFAKLLVELHDVEISAENQESSHSQPSNPVTTLRKGGRGRPRKIIDPVFLRDAMDHSRGMTVRELARRIKVHPHTLRSRLREHNIDYKYSTIPDSELDVLVKEFRQRYPSSGLRYLKGYLRRKCLRIQKSRIVCSLERVDKLGRSLRRRRQINISRKPYQVARPHALWHIDGHHKLIHWGFIIHGCIDGYSRMITGLQTSTNNRPSSVLRMFLTAVHKYGLPSRLRGDRGWENKLTAMLMIIKRGKNRGSFLWGTSTHNTRIERLWAELGSQFGRSWRAFFFRLENFHGLDRKNPHHLWLLHHLFLDLINKDCKDFEENWNTHPISGVGHDQSPKDLLFVGKLEHGEYKPCSEVDPDLINQLYRYENRHSRARNLDQEIDEEEWMGVSSDSDSGDEEYEVDGEGWREILAFSDDRDEWAGVDVEAYEEQAEEWFGIPDVNFDKGYHNADYSDLVDRLGEEERDKFNQEPVNAPKYANPFLTSDIFGIFEEALLQLHYSGQLPMGYGMHPSEWGIDGYPAFGTIHSRRGGKQIWIPLPDSIWRPRSLHWVRGLYLLNQLVNRQSQM